MVPSDKGLSSVVKEMIEVRSLSRAQFKLGLHTETVRVVDDFADSTSIIWTDIPLIAASSDLPPDVRYVHPAHGRIAIVTIVHAWRLCALR